MLGQSKDQPWLLRRGALYLEAGGVFELLRYNFPEQTELKLEGINV
jgi:hypothetical protein